MHGMGYIHADVKLGNLLLDADVTASPLRIFSRGAKLADFGCTSTQQQMKGRFIGTPQYMAPETLDGVHTPASDVYAFGIVAAELLTLTLHEPPESVPIADLGLSGAAATVARAKFKALLTGTPPARPSLGAEFDDVAAGDPRAPVAKAIVESCWASDGRSRPPMWLVAAVFEALARRRDPAGALADTWRCAVAHAGDNSPYLNAV